MILDKIASMSCKAAVKGNNRLPREQMEELLGVTPGSATVFGLMNDKEHRVRLLIDRDLLKDEYLGCHPCVNTSVVKIRTQDILDILLPHFGVVPVFVDLPDPSLQN